MILHPLVEYALLCFTTLLTLVNPLGIAPVFLALTERFGTAQRRSIAKKGAGTAALILIVFALIGSAIFSFYAITLNAFQIMGGILFFRSGLRMLEAIVSRTRSTPAEKEEGLDHDDIAVSPVGIPIIAGPGAITAAMMLSAQAESYIHYGILLAAILITLIITYLVFHGADRLAVRLGATGMRIIQRIMGIILMVIAVQFIINGVTPILTAIFKSAVSG